MERDLRRLADTRFDLIIVGAGFYGAVAAWDATLRGLSVAIIDKGDFGGATSFNNLKTLHGGLRSLQSLNFTQMRLFIRERRALARVAPHLVQPLAFVVPTYHHPARSRAAMRVALAITDLVSRDRHEGIADSALQLPGGRVISREECLRLNPLIDPEGVTGGAVWHDYQMHNTDRMTFSFVLSASNHGAAAANYVAADSVLREGDRVIGVSARDMISGQSFEIRGDIVLNAAGPWAAVLAESVAPRMSTPAPRLSRAMNLIVKRVEVSQACGGRAAGRFLFLAPWRDVTLVGTSHDVHQGSPDALTVSRDDIEVFLDEAREAFPRAHLSSSHVRLVHRGLLPMVSGQGRDVRLLRESTVVDHVVDGVRGLVSMFGVRYTTARATAEQAIDAVFRHRGVEPPPCRTAITPVAGGDIGDKQNFVKAVSLKQVDEIPSEMLERLARTYGTNCDAVLAILREDPALAQPLGERCAVSGAEILYALRHESAVKLTDTLIRRTEAGSAGHPGSDAVVRAAAIASRELGWDEMRTAQETEAVEAFYRLPA